MRIIKYDLMLSKPIFSVIGLSLLIVSNLVQDIIPSGLLLLIRCIGLFLCMVFIYTSLIKKRNCKREVIEGLDALVLYLKCMVEGCKICEFITLIVTGVCIAGKFLQLINGYISLCMNYLCVFILLDMAITVLYHVIRILVKHKRNTL